jgi:hypothetical protein
MNIAEIKASIGADVVAGVGELIENAVKEWANCLEASVDTNGNIWIEGPQTGHWLSEDKIIEFWAWNQAQ